MNSEFALIIAVGIILIVALVVGKRITFKLTGDDIGLTVDKNLRNTPDNSKVKDIARVEKVETSNIDIQTREHQDISVSDVKGSDVKIK